MTVRAINTPMTEAVGTSQKQLSFYRSTGHSMTEDGHLALLCSQQPANDICPQTVQPSATDF
jgi:hypothetical protein